MSDEINPLDQIHKLITEAVALDRDSIIKKEEQWPDEVKQEVWKIIESVRKVLDKDANDPRPIAERLVDARCKLGVLISHLSGASLSEMMEHELEMSRLAEAIAVIESVQEIFNPDLTNGN